MNKTDLEHQLLKGSIIYLNDIPTYRITLGQMVDFKFGYTVCNQCVMILSMDDEKAGELFSNDLEKTTFNFICTKIYTELYEMQQGKQMSNFDDNLLINIIPEFLQLFFNEHIVFDVQNLRFVIGDEKKAHYLSGDNYNEFRNILKERNCLIDIEEYEDENPSNEMAKRLLEQRKKYREKLKKRKTDNDDGEDLTMSDLISIFSEAEHLSLPFVYENYDVFQFNNQFNRLKIFTDYEVNIQALLAGCKKEDVNLQHWISKIKKQDD